MSPCGFGVRSCPREVISVKRYDIFGRAVQNFAADGFTAAGAALSNIADFTTQNVYDADDNLRLQGQVLPPQVP